MLRNTVTGISGVDDSVNEAARAVGMTESQRLLRVELPLALPVIIAGIRTATVWVVGIATLSTPVGAPSLGNYIFSGLQTRNFSAVMTGCVSAAALALLLDFLIRCLEVGMRERKRAVMAGPLLVLAGAAALHWVHLRQRSGHAPRQAGHHRREDLHRAIHLERGFGASDLPGDRGANTSPPLAWLDRSVRCTTERRPRRLRRTTRARSGQP